jgi:hypothetical protein
VAGDLHADEIPIAETLVARCAECAALAEELRSISLATASLPAPRRTRDFRLTPQQAAGLRGSEWTRLLRWLAAPRMAILQPLASAAVAIGLVLVVVGTGFPGQPAAPRSDDTGQAPMVHATGSPRPAAAHEFAATSDPTDRAVSTDGAAEPGEAEGTASATSDTGYEALPTPAAEATGAAATGASEATAQAFPPATSGTAPVMGVGGRSPDLLRPSVAPTTGATGQDAHNETPSPGTTDPDDITGTVAGRSPAASDDGGLAPRAARTKAPDTEALPETLGGAPAEPAGVGQAIVLLGAGLTAAGVVLLMLRLLARRLDTPR